MAPGIPLQLTGPGPPPPHLSQGQCDLAVGAVVLPGLGQCSKAGEPREARSAGRQGCLATGAVEDAAFLPDTLAAVRAGRANTQCVSMTVHLGNTV